MSGKSKQQLKLDNQTNFQNNNNGFITPDKLRNFHVDIIDSFLTQDGLDTLSTELQTETSERILADQSLSTAILQSGGEAISQEISNRISGDQLLSTSILTETSQRISADTSITTLLSTDYVPYTGGNSDIILNHTIAATGVKMDTINPYIVSNPGELGWNPVDGTIDLQLLNNTKLQLGQEIHIYAKSTETIENGDVVQYAGVQGDHFLIKKARPTEVQAEPELVIGVATQTIEANHFGYVTIFGKINGVFTSGFALKDKIWLDVSNPLVYGKITNIEPQIPHRKVQLGLVTKLNTGGAENGIITIRLNFGKKLTDLDDVNGTQPVKGSLLVYDDQGFFDFTSTVYDFATDTELSTAISTEASQRISADQSLSSKITLTTAIAKGAQQALSFLNYEGMVSYFNSNYLGEHRDNTTHVGQSIYIQRLDVPDVWISGNNFPSVIPKPYHYQSDEQLIADVAAKGFLQIGYYMISFLETQKVDLTDYATYTELSTAISTEASQRSFIDKNLSSALSTEISQRVSTDTILSTAISTEASDRISGDLSLSTGLSNEIARAISAELSLSTAIGQGGGGGTSETFVDITLLSANWSSNTQTVSAVGVTGSNTITIYAPLNRDQYLEYGRCKISATSQDTDTLAFTTSENPLFDISLKISYR